MLRRFLIAILVFLVVVVIAADRGGEVVAAHVLAGKLQSDENLPQRPDVSIHGIPFLSQAFRGRYQNVAITAHEVPVNGIRVTTLSANLKGVRLPFSKAIQGSASQLPVDRVTGSVFVSFADANAYLARHRVAGSVVTLHPGPGGDAAVTDRFQVAGHAVTLHGSGSLSVSGNLVTVDVARLAAGPLGGVASALLSSALNQLHISFPLRGLPFRLQLRSVSVTSGGLAGSGNADHVVLSNSN
jgi:hypothetical protein